MLEQLDSTNISKSLFRPWEIPCLYLFMMQICVAYVFVVVIVIVALFVLVTLGMPKRRGIVCSLRAAATVLGMEGWAVLIPRAAFEDAPVNPVYRGEGIDSKRIRNMPQISELQEAELGCKTWNLTPACRCLVSLAQQRRPDRMCCGWWWKEVRARPHWPEVWPRVSSGWGKPLNIS